MPRLSNRGRIAVGALVVLASIGVAVPAQAATPGEVRICSGSELRTTYAVYPENGSGVAGTLAAGVCSYVNFSGTATVIFGTSGLAVQVTAYDKGGYCAVTYKNSSGKPAYYTC